MRRMFSGALAVIVGFLGMTLSFAESAHASCDPAPNNYFDGANSAFQSAIFGGRARIEYNKVSPLCKPPPASLGRSSVWTMVTAHSATAGGYDGYAQVGYTHEGIDSPGEPGYHVFAQWTRQCLAAGRCSIYDGDKALKTRFDPAPTGAMLYSVYRKASRNRIIMYAGENRVATMGYDTQGIWQSNWAVGYYGETKNRDDDMPGTTADPTDFTSLQKYDSTGQLVLFRRDELSLSELELSKFRHEFFPQPAPQEVGLRIWTHRG